MATLVLIVRSIGQELFVTNVCQFIILLEPQWCKEFPRTASIGWTMRDHWDGKLFNVHVLMLLEAGTRPL